MQLNWMKAATLAIAATTGVPLAASAQAPSYNISDAGGQPALEVEPGDVLAPAGYSYANTNTNAYAYSAGSAAGAGASCQPCVEQEAVCEPWRLFCQKDCGINVYGWVSGGIMGNSQSPASSFNGPVTFPDRDYGQLNQAYAIAEKTIDTGGCGWDWGGRVDFLYGTDYIFTQATGLELDDDGSSRWNGNPNYGLALPQAYAEVGYNNLSAKLGHFYTPIGYEVVPATGNFFYSHAYTMQYGEPFTHTGGIANWKAADDLTLVAAFVNGWDAFDRVSDSGMGIAGFNYAASDNLSIAYNYGYSANESTLDGRQTPRHISSLVVSYNRGDWSYVFQNDVGWQQEGIDDGSGSADPFSSAEWYGVNQYLFYTINDCWKAGVRAEWFRDDDGVRVGGIRPGQTIPASGFAGNFYELTAGMNWTPHANITVRPEVRYDWYDGESAGGIQPFDDGSRTDQLLYGVDLIVLW
ncbi:MAG: porin [Pirellulaceae bacterium]